MQLGALVLRPNDEATWRHNLDLFARMKATVAKVDLPRGFGHTPASVEELIDAGAKTIIYHPHGRLPSINQTVNELVGREFYALVSRYPEVRWVCELGNEPERPPDVLDHWSYRYRQLVTVTTLRPRYPGLEWIASAPIKTNHVYDWLTTTDVHGNIARDFDGFGPHIYAWTDPATDSAGEDWQASYRFILDHTDKEVWITEIGIDAGGLPKAEKGRRIVSWLARQPPQVAGATVFLIGPWAENDHYDIDGAMADALADRPMRASEPHPELTPETEPTPPREQEPSMPYGIRGLIDIRDRLPRNPSGGPNRRVPLSQKRGVVLHYSGPPIAERRDPLEVMRSEAQYHITLDWGDGQGLYGDGYQYHIAVDQQGNTYLCRDLEDVLWHCGAWPQNGTALSLHALLGGDQEPSEAMLRALGEVCDDYFAAGHGDPRTETWGHQELSPTSCPGTLQGAFVVPYRLGQEPGMADGCYFSETQHYLGGGFYRYWLEHGGLMQYGYPLTEEMQEDGRTVQYFERAVFEYWPENEPPYDILLRRLGAEALAARDND